MSQLIALGALVAMFFAAFFPGAPVRTVIDGAQSVRAVVQQAASKVDLWSDRSASNAPGSAATSLDGKVVGVSDGDTITLLDRDNRQHRIRLMGIDAPEKAQAYGQRSKASLSAAVFSRTVQAQCGQVDQYQRRICKVMVDGRDINLAQVQAGMAWHYKAYEGSQAAADRASYAEAQRQAMKQQRGLWADPSPVPPWDFRRAQKTGA